MFSVFLVKHFVNNGYWCPKNFQGHATKNPTSTAIKIRKTEKTAIQHRTKRFCFDGETGTTKNPWQFLPKHPAFRHHTWFLQASDLLLLRPSEFLAAECGCKFGCKRKLLFWISTGTRGSFQIQLQLQLFVSDFQKHYRSNIHILSDWIMARH